MSTRIDRAAVLTTVEETGVVAVIRLQDAGAVRAVADALGAGGVRAIEVTMTVPGAVELIAQLVKTLPSTSVVGAGTVMDVDTAHRVMDAGAAFVVSPIFRPDVVAACSAAAVAVMPGCFSPSEIHAAWSAGADIVKVFPATALGATYFKDLRGPMPQLKLMPTGGVSLENAASWIRAGAVALGVGTSLVDPKLVASRSFDVLTTRARAFVDAVAAARSGAAS
jgi:2-dehydro-3-deoxyphosphogluconate aldolase/(4S)-4-hydroxy-2-oxoglutarate aldolase